MTIHWGLKLMLIAGVMASGGGLRAKAQTHAGDTSTGNFYVKLTAVPSTRPEEVTARKHSVVPSAVYWDNLYNVGKVAVFGSARDGSMTFGVVILEGVTEAEAHAIADGVPSVKAGLTTAEVLPMQMYLNSAPRPRAAQKAAR